MLGSRGLFIPALAVQQQQLCPVGCGHVLEASDDLASKRGCDMRLCRNLTVREYLSAVYPSARSRLSTATPDYVDELFRSLHFYYDYGCQFDGSRCSRTPGVLLRWLYDGLLPCKASSSQDCVAERARFSPEWGSLFDPTTGWLEVEHRSTAAGLNASAHYNSLLAHDATSFLDGGLASMWYTYRRGSGIFYRLGRAKKAVDRTAILADLLLEVASHRSLNAAWPAMAQRLNFTSSSLDAAKDSLQIRALSTGRRFCHSLGIRGCRCGNTLPENWDNAIIWAARGLGYESLLLTASLFCKQGGGGDGTGKGTVTPMALPEIVDVRPLRPSWHREQEAGTLDNDILDGTYEQETRFRRKKAVIAAEWVEHLREHKVLSLRDPARLDDESAAQSCVFSVETMSLSCAGHVSSTWQSSEWAQCGWATLSCKARATADASASSSVLTSEPAVRAPPVSGPPPATTAIPLPAAVADSPAPPTWQQQWLESAAAVAASTGSISSPETVRAAGASETMTTTAATTGEDPAIYRFTFTGVRGAGSSDGLQLSEIMLFDSGGRVLPVAVALNPNGNRPSRQQGAPAAVDGSFVTKWFDSSVASNSGASKLLLQLAGSTGGSDPVAAYDFYTANDNPQRDPVDWELHVRDHTGGEWKLIDHAEGLSPPLERRTSYGRRAIHRGTGATPIHLLAARETVGKMM